MRRSDIERIRSMSELFERIAANEHKRWSVWMSAMLANMTDEHIEWWVKLAETPYDELSEDEKEMARDQANMMLSDVPELSAAYNLCGD